MSTCIKAEGLSFAYSANGDNRSILNAVSLDVKSGEFICLTGPSGSGKSTLLNILGLLEAPQSGSLYFSGQRVDLNKELVREQIRRDKIGFVFQDFQLFDVLSAAENVDYFLARQGLRPSVRRQLVETHLREVGLWELRDRRPSQLSGGQKQRLAVARALAKSPVVIVADEPTANLDRENARIVLSTLSNLCELRGVTVIMASHDPLALEYCSRAFELSDGCLFVQPKGGSHAA